MNKIMEALQRANDLLSNQCYPTGYIEEAIAELERIEQIKDIEIIKEMREVMKMNADRFEVMGLPAESLRCILEKSKDYE